MSWVAESGRSAGRMAESGVFVKGVDVKRFLLITNIHKDKERKLTGRLKNYIEMRGGSCTCFYSSGERVEDAAPRADEIPSGVDCVMGLGGDGTLIRAASALVNSRLPFVGVNLGTLGYLCELEEGSVFAAIDQMMSGACMVEERMLLQGAGMCRQEDILSGEGQSPECGKDEDAAEKGCIPWSAGEICPERKPVQRAALNDIVIYRTGPLSVVSLIVYVNGEYLHTFRADGIILATPTGSTGYNMSAGGPIVDPKAEMILITPINAHNLSSRSIVVGAEDEIVVEIGRRRFRRDESVEVSFDGDTVAKLAVGDRFFVRRAKETVRICRLSRKSFLEILSRKMQMYT